jgi:alpha-glucosidase
VVYQIYPRSFADGNGDGVGDLPGLLGHLDHLSWLGVDAVWLSPIYRSPMADFGYDVADHCDVDPVFGTLADADRLIEAAHALGIRVILDWVPNHTSSAHPWFVESRSSRDSPKRDWYIWRDRPNNWRAAFTQKMAWVVDPATGQRRRVAVGERTDPSAWTYDERTDQWYLHLFLPEQPDLNWENPEVRAAMLDVLRFWLDRGVDGFRADVIHGIGKDPALPDDPPELAGIPHASLDGPRSHLWVREIRRLLDTYPGERMIVGEVYLLSTKLVATYYGRGDELHLAFNFPPLYAPWEAAAWRRRIERVVEEIHPVGWPTWVLSNHDNMRHRSRYGGSEARARAAAVLLLGLRGTPFLYQGEELGLEDADVPPEREVDPGGRDGCRAPIPWEPGPGHGWPAEPWLPWPPEPDVRNVASLRADPGSILHLYRRLLAARSASCALHGGDFDWLETPEGVLAWVRHDPATGDRRAVAVNFTAEERPCPIPGDWTVEVATSAADERQPFPGVLAPDAACVLRPSSTNSRQ